jgi:hypothetical protein
LASYVLSTFLIVTQQVAHPAQCLDALVAQFVAEIADVDIYDIGIRFFPLSQTCSQSWARVTTVPQ